MAGLAAGPVGKDVLLDALSNREGAATPAGDETAADLAGFATDPISEEEAAQRDSFEEFLNEPDSGAEDQNDIAVENFLSEAEDGAGVNQSFRRSRSNSKDLYGGPDTVCKPGGVMATYRGSSELTKSLQAQRTVKGLERLRRDYAAKVKAAEDARSTLEDEEQKLRSLRKQAEVGKLSDPARLGYQEREVSKAWGRLTECEKARDTAELVLHRAGDDGARAERACSQEASHHNGVAFERQDGEVRRAQRALSQDAAARQAARDHQQACEDEARRRASEARKHQSMGKARLKATLAKHEERNQEVEEIREIRFQHDAQRLLTLKKSVDTVNRQMQSSNEAKRKKQEKVRAEREERRQQLLSEGQNPYEVWRREEMEAEKERQKTKLKALNELRSERLLEQLMTEEQAYKRNREVEKKNRQMKDEFQKEMGNYAKEKKVAAYIRKMTIGNVDVLDPTGTALRIDPSKITVQKTHAFGLGRAPPSEIDKVDRDMARTNKMLASRRPPRPSSADSLGSRDLGGDGAATGDLRAVSVAEEDDGMLGEGPEEALPEGKLWVPKLTKLEEQYLAAAKERQKENITSVQRCWGKEFKGDAFLAKPSVIAFDDFEVGKKYRQVIEVTNVSLTFNQFKLLPLEDKYKEFFEVQFEPPGRMSAGVTRYITLWFLPKVPENIVTTFPILAKTGRIDFPLRCTTKKTILTITPQDADENPLIDFGQVLSGETGNCVLRVKNMGALAAKFDLEPEDPSNDFYQSVSWEPQRSEFRAHGTTNISFTFKPEAVGNYVTALRLSITNGAAGDARFQEVKSVLLRGSCIDVPIYVEKELYDLKTCIFGHIFRENVVIHNRRSVPMKIEVEKPKQIDGQLQINPVLAYIQGNKEQAIQVKFSPKEDFLDKNPQYRDQSRTGVLGAFRIPVKIVGAEQALPVHTALTGTLTTNNLRFEPSILNFGRCFVGSTAVSRLTVINESLLPQRYVFTRLPSFLSVMEIPKDVIEEQQADSRGIETAVLDGGDDGAFGTLLPGERRQLCVAYQPEAATEMKVKVQLKAITGALCAREFGIDCRGQGVTPLLTLSHTNVDLASIPSGSVSTESVVISNVSKVPYTMNLVLPPQELSGLKASPVCVTLAPHQTQRVQLEFRPTEDYVKSFQMPEEPPAEEGDGEGAAGGGEEGAPQEPKETPEEFRSRMLCEVRKHGGRRWENEEGRSVHARWKLAIHMRPAQAKGNGTGEQAVKKEAQVMYLGLSTCVLPPILTASPAILDFGEVTAQQRKILPLTLQAEAGVDPQHLRLDALPESQCFTVLSAPRTVEGKPFQLMVEFHPKLVQIYQSVLQLRTQSTRVQVPLRGRGVRPVLKIQPEDGVLRLGSVTFGKERKDHTKEELVIHNDSPFELCYSLETVAGADPNHTGPPPFSLAPSTGVVEANGSKIVTVTFRPHRPMALFREKVLVNVPNQKEPTFVYLYGHCFKYQTYALSGLDFVPFRRAEAKGPVALVDSLAAGLGSGADPETGQFEYPQAQQREFSLKFGEGERTQYLLVGASVPPGYPSAPQNTPATAFEFQIVPSEHSKYFTVEAPEGAKPDKMAKGQVAPGKQPIKVVFKYQPEENTSLKYGDVDLDLLGGIGQWITCQVKGVLSGGFVPPGAPATQEISVELRAYLQQI